jgi:hypothetical protein
MAKVCSWLGLHDAARKRREPSTTPGAWAGAVIVSDKRGVYKLVTNVPWEKTHRKIWWFALYQLGLLLEDDGNETLCKDQKACPSGYLPHKMAKLCRGFLVYILCTYSAMVPYLKGIHLTIDSWQPHCNQDGWKNTSTVEAKCERRSKTNRLAL